MIQKKITTKKSKIAHRDNRKTYLFWSIVIPLLMVFALFAWQHRVGLTYLVQRALGKKELSRESNADHDIRNVALMRRHIDKVFGIDVSQYQGDISWNYLHTINEEFPVDFVFIRATMGEKAVDHKFKENWKQAVKNTKLRGAYHYFRPNENSIKQAKNFIRTVTLNSGDLPPVLDIEERPRSQPMDSLRVGLRRWLDTVEGHYGIRPILYSGDRYYADFLEREFSDYTLWIANYNFWIEKPKEHWNFWQFSERGTVSGINGPVDLNMFQGTIEDLEGLCVPYL